MIQSSDPNTRRPSRKLYRLLYEPDLLLDPAERIQALERYVENLRVQLAHTSKPKRGQRLQELLVMANSGLDMWREGRLRREVGPEGTFLSQPDIRSSGPAERRG